MRRQAEGGRRLRRLILTGLSAALTTALALPVLAQAPGRVIGVMSLVADEFVVVGQVGTTGTKLDQNRRETVPIEAGALERTVLGTVMKAIGRADAAAKVMPMLINEPRYYKGQDDWLDGDKATLPAEVAEALRGARMTHLVLVQKLRADARMNTGRASLGTGKLEGLGFYVDRITRIQLLGTSVTTVGYLAPYVYARVSLIDLGNLRVLARRDITHGEVVLGSQAGARSGDPWEWLDAKGKVQAIASMIEQDMDAAVTALMKGS